ncbi:MAG: hypothetical protein RJA35_610, partial [Actinomycetota bacterium]
MKFASRAKVIATVAAVASMLVGGIVAAPAALAAPATGFNQITVTRSFSSGGTIDVRAGEAVDVTVMLQTRNTTYPTAAYSAGDAITMAFNETVPSGLTVGSRSCGNGTRFLSANYMYSRSVYNCANNQIVVSTADAAAPVKFFDFGFQFTVTNNTSSTLVYGVSPTLSETLSGVTSTLAPSKYTTQLSASISTGAVTSYVADSADTKFNMTLPLTCLARNFAGTTFDVATQISVGGTPLASSANTFYGAAVQNNANNTWPSNVGRITGYYADANYIYLVLDKPFNVVHDWYMTYNFNGTVADTGTALDASYSSIMEASATVLKIQNSGRMAVAGSSQNPVAISGTVTGSNGAYGQFASYVAGSNLSSITASAQVQVASVVAGATYTATTDLVDSLGNSVS